ncbi:MAG: hydrogenase formation protein HypD [Deltaproteobacteria bacterium]|nr:hydrogenase formation protein HypD [Deltaproteobacteria bacterium]MBW2660429.1 hydrogenase formation protein HypD [Deltaproteobacteria bacterium]
MTIKHIEEYRDPEISKSIIENIKKLSKTNIRLMEVCGTHTMSIFRSGIRALLPDSISLLSGIGCPVCVTNQKEIDTFIGIARANDVIVTTFGDLMRVPGTDSSLQKERASGRDIRVVYSTFDALEIARKNPDKRVVFLGVGFETTAPTIAATIFSAKKRKLDNFFVFSAHKIVPPALDVLMQTKDVKIDGFILPGHVSVIIGTKAYLQFFEKYKIPCVIAGFEPIDILQPISILVEQIESGAPELINGYPRVVTFDGNKKAQKIMGDIFEIVDVAWRGIGVIPKSGLRIRERFSAFDAEKMIDFSVPESKDPKGCACGEILTGLKIPPECSLYKNVCTPMDPVGPCMVSSEGTCAAYYRYHNS